MAVLTGFLFGSLAIVWPWKRVLSWIEGSDGLPKPVQQQPVLPGDFAVYSGQDPQLALCLALVGVGFGLVWLIARKWGQSAPA